MLLGIKTDGGTPEEAKAFLASKGADPERWVVASDMEEAYYQRIIAETPLWGYAVVAPDGGRSEAGQAGLFFGGGGPKRFALPSKRAEFDKAYAKSTATVLPKGKDYPKELSRAVQLAESGRLASAIAAARTVGGQSGKEMEDDLLSVATTRLTDLETKARDAADPQRYVAFMGLRDLTTQLRGLPPAKASQKAVSEIAKDKVIAREQKAENAWRGLLAAVEKQPKEKRGEAMKASVPGFIKAYEGTYFARVAGESAQ